MINFTALEDAVYAIVQPILDVPTIFANQNAPRPPLGTYAAIYFMDFEQMGTANWRQVDDAGTSAYVNQYALTVSFRVLRGDANETISTLQGSLSTDTVIDQFLAAGLSISTFFAVLETEVPQQTEWEQIAELQVVFFYHVAETDDTGVIEHTNLQGNYPNGPTEPPIIINP